VGGWSEAVSLIMSETDTETFGHVYEPMRGTRRKVEFVPRDDGRFDRIEMVWTGCAWRVTGQERVSLIRRL